MDMILFIFLSFSFLPWILAGIRKHNNYVAIIIINLIAIVVAVYWSIENIVLYDNLKHGLLSIEQTPVMILMGLMAWLVALVWSCTDNCKKVEAVKEIKQEPIQNVNGPIVLNKYSSTEKNDVFTW